VQGSKGKVDGSFLATILETASVGVLYLAWKSITEGTSFHHRVSFFADRGVYNAAFSPNLVMLTICIFNRVMGRGAVLFTIIDIQFISTTLFFFCRLTCV
jgi:hypothetical protein